MTLGGARHNSPLDLNTSDNVNSRGVSVKDKNVSVHQDPKAYSNDQMYSSLFVLLFCHHHIILLFITSKFIILKIIQLYHNHFALLVKFKSFECGPTQLVFVKIRYCIIRVRLAQCR